MEVVIYNCNKGSEVERFKLSPYKMDTFLEEMHCQGQCNTCNNGVLVELYESGRLTMSKRTNLTPQLERLLKSNKSLLA
ncbi:hypothetical protein BCT04_16510 [Vibrio breoganii]|uniref:DUF1450 domain-containing protein n=1 Tax=Vibrio breoganii TaxID=553239 RepID=A0ABX1UEP8_9VIBR|nr:hypothetical protein [Vibrio breoganii]NMO73537.1 hypothetical protein [Vibrio breoganii]NMR71572.1 hypothetical protein [Vibrio breoganii]PMG01432.1 hypothetical protein BCV02_14585 [Vibrio breoganii]PML90154.1 hypothetical protein BCT67_00325 [Vibrio breoganii]PMO62577.1 hypothetical protein BCT04_16510 [Vibrio breoganii]